MDLSKIRGTPPETQPLEDLGTNMEDPRRGIGRLSDVAIRYGPMFLLETPSFDGWLGRCPRGERDAVERARAYVR